MHELPRQMLRKIIMKYGKEICSDSRRCEGLLNDLCGSYRREINVLVIAIDERIPLDLLAGAESISTELLLRRLEKRLEEQTALTEEAARWAVESWALALDITTDDEIEEIRRKNVSPPGTTAERIEPPKFEGKSTNQAIPNINHINPVPPKAQNSTPSTKPAPSINRQSAKAPANLPSYNAPVNNQVPIPGQPVSPQAQSSNPKSIPGRRSYWLRGCLIVIFMLAVVSVVLFLGVPYAIEMMRETQRDKNTAPPRFPSR